MSMGHTCSVKRRLSSLLDEEEQEAHGSSDGVKMDQRGTTTDQRERKTMKCSFRPDVEDFGVYASPKEEKKGGLFSNLLRRNQKPADKSHKSKMNKKNEQKVGVKSDVKMHELYFVAGAGCDLMEETQYKDPAEYLTTVPTKGDANLEQCSTLPDMAKDTHDGDSCDSFTSFDEDDDAGSENQYEITEYQDDSQRSSSVQMVDNPQYNVYRSYQPESHYRLSTPYTNTVSSTFSLPGHSALISQGHSSLNDDAAASNLSSLQSSCHTGCELYSDIHQQQWNVTHEQQAISQTNLPPRESELLPRCQHSGNQASTLSYIQSSGNDAHDSNPHGVQYGARTLPLTTRGRLLLPDEIPQEQDREFIDMGVKLARQTCNTESGYIRLQNNSARLRQFVSPNQMSSPQEQYYEELV